MYSTVINIRTWLIGSVGIGFLILSALLLNPTTKTSIAHLDMAKKITASQYMPSFSGSSKRDSKVKLLSVQAGNLNPDVLKLGLTAYDNAVKQGITQEKILTIVDFSKPSTEPRLWVIDLENNRVLFQELVAHGRNSGENYATSFSNHPSSNKSSLGVYVTDKTYDGKHGYSLKLNGLEKGFNDMAEARAIVMHSAEYVSQAVIKATGRLGRSQGCLALNPAVSTKIINAIKNRTLIFVYYPTLEWIKHSRFLMN